MESTAAAVPAQKAVVRTDGDSVSVSLTLQGRQRTLQRSGSEQVSKALKRLQLSAVPAADKKAKRTKKGAVAPQGGGQVVAPMAADAASPAEPVVALHLGFTADSAVVPGETPNASAWTQAAMLVVGDVQYEVEVNPPTCDKLEAIGQLMVGYPVLPLATLRFAREEDCGWRWFTQRGTGDWHEEGAGCSGRTFTPGGDAEGALLRVECTPGMRREDGSLRQGEAASLVLGRVAAALPAPGFLARQAATASVLGPPALRVVSYNLLADQYSSMEAAKPDSGLFSYCPPAYLDIEYRRVLLLRELLGYRADVMALQEVDEKMFRLYLHPHLREHGYEGVYANKAGAVSEGEALFWRASRYRAVAVQALSLKQAFHDALHSGDPTHPAAPLLPLLQASPALAHALQRVTQVAQMVLLAPVAPAAGDGGEQDDEGPLCVVNTHLFFHPRGPHIRIMHLAVIAAAADEFMRGAAGDAALHGRAPALLLCGDLNSNVADRMPGALELLRSGMCPGDYPDWEKGASFVFSVDGAGDGEADALGAGTTDELDDAAVDVIAAAPGGMEPRSTSVIAPPPGAAFDASGRLIGCDVSIPFRLRSSDDFTLPYSNYVRGFIGLLDYVWHEPLRMRASAVLPMPAPAELQQWLPSQQWPSDHLAVVFDLEWLPLAEQRHWRPSGSQLQDVAATVPPTCSDYVGSFHPLPAKPCYASVAVAALQRGELVAVPLERGHGLVASTASPEGSRRLQAVAARSPVILCAQRADDVARCASVAHLPSGLLPALLAHPAVVQLPLADGSTQPPAQAGTGGSTVGGVHLSGSSLLFEVMQQLGVPLLLVPGMDGAGCSSAEGVRQLWRQCGAVFVCDRQGEGQAAVTVVDMTRTGSFRLQGSCAEAEVARSVLLKHGLIER